MAYFECPFPLPVRGRAEIGARLDNRFDEELPVPAEWVDPYRKATIAAAAERSAAFVAHHLETMAVPGSEEFPWHVAPASAGVLANFLFFMETLCAVADISALPPDYFEDMLLSVPQTVFMVAESREKYSVGGLIAFSTWYRMDALEVALVCTFPSFQRQGIGRALVAIAMEMGRRSGLRYAVAETVKVSETGKEPRSLSKPMFVSMGWKVALAIESADGWAKLESEELSRYARQPLLARPHSALQDDKVKYDVYYDMWLPREDSHEEDFADRVLPDHFRGRDGRVILPADDTARIHGGIVFNMCLHIGTGALLRAYEIFSVKLAEEKMLDDPRMQKRRPFGIVDENQTSSAYRVLDESDAKEFDTWVKVLALKYALFSSLEKDPDLYPGSVRGQKAGVRMAHNGLFALRAGLIMELATTCMVSLQSGLFVQTVIELETKEGRIFRPQVARMADGSVEATAKEEGIMYASFAFHMQDTYGVGPVLSLGSNPTATPEIGEAEWDILTSIVRSWDQRYDLYDEGLLLELYELLPGGSELGEEITASRQYLFLSAVLAYRLGTWWYGTMRGARAKQILAELRKKRADSGLGTYGVYNHSVRTEYAKRVSTVQTVDLSGRERELRSRAAPLAARVYALPEPVWVERLLVYALGFIDGLRVYKDISHGGRGLYKRASVAVMNMRAAEVQRVRTWFARAGRVNIILELLHDLDLDTADIRTLISDSATDRKAHLAAAFGALVPENDSPARKLALESVLWKMGSVWLGGIQSALKGEEEESEPMMEEGEAVSLI